MTDDHHSVERVETFGADFKGFVEQSASSVFARNVQAMYVNRPVAASAQIEQPESYCSQVSCLMQEPNVAERHVSEQKVHNKLFNFSDFQKLIFLVLSVVVNASSN